MRVVEYKLVWKPGNHKETPDYIRDGGYWSNGKSLVAVIPNEQDLDYYIPNDAVTELTLQELIDRCIAEQNKPGSFDRQTDVEGNVLNDTQLTELVTDWWNNVTGETA
jgi:hypothetical protein